MIKSFEKVAAAGSEIMKTLTNAAKKTQIAGKGGFQGLKAGLSGAAKDTVGDTAKVLPGLKKGYEHITKNLKNAKGLSGKSKVIGEGLGKAAPSLATGTAYAMAGKKVYDKATGGNDESGYY